MSKDGWEFIAQALKKEGLSFTHACVRIDDCFGQIAVEDLRTWLEQMTFLDDPSDPAWQDNPDPTPPGRTFDFAIWDSEGHVWYPSSHDGVAHLGRRPALPAAWLREYRTSIDEPGLIELGQYSMADLEPHVDALREAAAKNVAARGEVVSEIDRIVAAGPEATEIPLELQWNSDEDTFEIDGQQYVLQRDSGESDQEYEERKKLFDDLKKSGGRLSIGVEDLSEFDIARLREKPKAPSTFDLGRDSAYHVAREFMRNRIATLSAEIARLENEIVDVGVEMSGLDYRDRDAIERAIEKYRAGVKIEVAEGLRQADRGDFSERTVRDIAESVIEEGDDEQDSET